MKCKLSYVDPALPRISIDHDGKVSRVHYNIAYAPKPQYICYSDEITIDGMREYDRLRSIGLYHAAAWTQVKADMRKAKEGPGLFGDNDFATVKAKPVVVYKRQPARTLEPVAAVAPVAPVAPVVPVVTVNPVVAVAPVAPVAPVASENPFLACVTPFIDTSKMSADQYKAMITEAHATGKNFRIDTVLPVHIMESIVYSNSNDANYANRDVDDDAHQRHMASLKHAMATKKFVPGSCVYVDAGGNGDGQSRMIMAIEIGMPLPVTISIGYKGFRQFANSGKSNTKKDSVKLSKGLTSQGQTVSSLVAEYTQGTVMSRTLQHAATATSDEKVRFERFLPEAREVIKDQAGTKSNISPAIIAAAAVLLSENFSEAHGREFLTAMTQIKRRGAVLQAAQWSDADKKSNTCRGSSFARVMDAAFKMTGVTLNQRKAAFPNRYNKTEVAA
jgi:hypothetical protein